MSLTAEEKTQNFLNERELMHFIQAGAPLDAGGVLIVGGGPSAALEDDHWYNTWDVIVRMNNYKMIGNSRTDIYFSYFGRNIKKRHEELKADGVKFMVNKYPNDSMEEEFNYCGFDIDDKDYRWVYELRKDWWKEMGCPLISFTRCQLMDQIQQLDGHMPTIGFSAVDYILNFVTDVTIIGFDCFESGVHNLDEPWDNSGNHNLAAEKRILLELEETGELTWIK